MSGVGSCGLKCSNGSGEVRIMEWHDEECISADKRIPSSVPSASDAHADDDDEDNDEDGLLGGSESINNKGNIVMRGSGETLLWYMDSYQGATNGDLAYLVLEKVPKIFDVFISFNFPFTNRFKNS